MTLRWHGVDNMSQQLPMRTLGCADGTQVIYAITPQRPCSVVEGPMQMLYGATEDWDTCQGVEPAHATNPPRPASSCVVPG